MKPKTKRLLSLLSIFLGIAAAAGLIIYALQDQMMYYKTPSEVKRENLKKNFRLGGFVKEGSLEREDDGTFHFDVTDFETTLPVTFKGFLPALFREGQGVIAEGKFENNLFIANNILAKHDENYRPPVMDKIKN